ncbi:MAG: hypothetical protein AAFY54_19425, partial [Cyanobacteria bacterium J06648_10]
MSVASSSANISVSSVSGLPVSGLQSANPLLIGHGLPPFRNIQPEHVVPGIHQLLETLEAQ